MKLKQVPPSYRLLLYFVEIYTSFVDTSNTQNSFSKMAVSGFCSHDLFREAQKGKSW